MDKHFLIYFNTRQTMKGRLSEMKKIAAIFRKYTQRTNKIVLAVIFNFPQILNV